MYLKMPGSPLHENAIKIEKTPKRTGSKNKEKYVLSITLKFKNFV